MANWGIGIGAFSDGIVKGMALGKAIKETRDQAQIEKLTKGGMEQAKLAREQAVNGAVQTLPNPGDMGGQGVMAPGQAAAAAGPGQMPATGDMGGRGVMAPAAASGIGGPATPANPLEGLATPNDVLGLPKEGTPKPPELTKTPFEVEGRKFATKDEATKAADADAAPVMDFFMRDAAPKIRDAYIAQGKIEQAEKFGTWIEDTNTKTGMRHWSQAVSAAQAGDYDTAARKLVKAYNTPGYFDDGYTAGDAELMKDDGGNVTGFRIKMKGKDGKEHSQEYANTEDMIAAGMGLLSPQARFKAVYDESMAAKKAKLESASERAKEERQQERELGKIKYTAEVNSRVEKFKSDLRKSEESHKAQFKTGPDGKKNAYRPSRSPEDLAGDFRKILIKDYSFQRLKPAEQDAEIWRQVQSIYPGAKPGQPRDVAQEQGAGDAGGVPIVRFDE